MYLHRIVILNCRDLHWIKNDRTRVRVGCKKGCEWLALCVKLPNEDTWQLRKIIDNHSCSLEYRVKMMNSAWLGKKLLKSVRENPKIKLFVIQNKAHEKWNAGISKMKASRARRVAIDLVDGSFKEQYSRLYDYAHELLRSNPNNTIKINVQATEQGRVTDNVDEIVDRPLLPSFQRMYIGLHGCKQSFLICRPIIGLDGCFLKGYYGGQILAAVGRDPNEQMLPIAFAVVEGENKYSWAWFLDLMVNDLGGPEVCRGFTFMSDQQKGLLPAMEELLPGVDQRFCVRHLYNNFRRPPRSVPSHPRLQRRRCAPIFATVASVKENLGRIQKTLSDFTSLNQWVVRDYYRLVNSVNAFEPRIQSLSDEQLAAKTEEFRLRLTRGETLADIQAEAFAVVREAAIRKLGMRHFDVQIIGGAVLHDGSIAEMKTGEGKTLVSTLAAYLNALTAEGVHVVTVNDYLAQRDAEWMGRVHRFLGLSVGLIQRGMKSEERRFNYRCDITYTNNSELGFDYLRDNLAGSSEQLVMRWPKPFHFAIVDEVDSVLIDEGRNPLLISGEASKDAARYPVAAKVAELLIQGTHYKVELKNNSVELTEEGIALAEMALETNDLWDENDPWARFVMNALKAKEFYRRDVQYMVRDGKALIINELTGRVEEKRRWSEGIHQAVEAKEGLKIQADSVVVAQITYQSLFKLYPKLSGMTGTAKTEEKEFLKMFQVPVIEVPTNLPNIRKDFPIQAFATARGKWDQVRREVEYMFKQGRPILVGTTSVENSELLAGLLGEWNIPHNVLNARPKYAAREAEIVAQAGRKHAITISTNMAGRGTDIILGGNPKMLAREIIEDSILPFLTREDPNLELASEAISQKVLPKIKVGSSSLALLAKTALMAKYVSKSEGKSWTYQKAKSFILEAVEMSISHGLKELEKVANEESEIYPLGPTVAITYLQVLKDCEKHCLLEGSEVKRLGGLHVIGTSLHESRRIDNQLRGRAGRQGDPGSTRFMVSLQDEIFQKFNFDTEWAVRLISKITNDEDLPIEGDAIVKQLLALQINAEKFFFGIRKSLVEFDEVLEVQRKHVYDLRQLILTGNDESCSQNILQYMQAVVDEIVFSNIDPLKHPHSWDLGNLLKEFMAIGGKLLHESFVGISDDTLRNSLGQLNGVSSVDVVNLRLPNLPAPPNAFRGIRTKTSSLRRWLAICTDDLIENGKYRMTCNLLRKYLGDFLIASYLNVVEESGYDERHVKEIERAVLLKTLDCFWRDHLVNMNRLSSAVNVRSFGHRNPLEEYKIDGCRFFISMLSATRRLTIEALLRHWTSPMESQELFL